MGNELSKSVKDQIISDAKMRTGFDENKDHKPYDKGMYHGFVSAACIYTDKAQVLVDALEEILKQHTYYDVIELAANALQQFKDGKGKDSPCPHCGKELSRDRNLCCRACGKEVENDSK